VNRILQKGFRLEERRVRVEEPGKRRWRRKEKKENRRI
jgi:hypothetical protein